MASTDFADLIHQPVSFDSDLPADKLILDLIDSKWIQRLRDISQTANTRLVYMFSEHSRFGHSLGVAYLASLLCKTLEKQNKEEVVKYKLAVCSAALLHDIGHLAPGSHTAINTWFPNAEDKHESLGQRIICADEEIGSILETAQPGLTKLVASILEEDKSLPAWTWQVISGGSWNVDRGNWCVVDSILAGVSYGKYNVGALIDSFFIAEDKQLALRENRLDAMVHFAISRNAMYRQVYQHRVILAADVLNRLVVKRARAIFDQLPFCDANMEKVLHAQDVEELSLETVFEMRESWWRYHLSTWSKSNDKILADLSSRILFRKLFKTVRIKGNKSEVLESATQAVISAGYDPDYYLQHVSTSDQFLLDSHQAMLIKMDSGLLAAVTEVDPLLSSLGKEQKQNSKEWLVMPAEAKSRL